MFRQTRRMDVLLLFSAEPASEALRRVPGDLGFRIHHSFIVIFNYSFLHSLIRLFDCLIVCLFVCCNIDLRQVSRTCEFSPLSAPLKEQVNKRSNLHSECCSIDSALRIYYFVIDPLIHENLWEARKGAEVGSAIYLSMASQTDKEKERKKEGRRERKYQCAGNSKEKEDFGASISRFRLRLSRRGGGRE